MEEMTLEAARVNAGYNQQEAGALFGVHYQTIAKWENDNTKMPYEMIEKIPNIYGVPPNSIFFWQEKRVYSFVKKESQWIEGRDEPCHQIKKSRQD